MNINSVNQSIQQFQSITLDALIMTNVNLDRMNALISAKIRTAHMFASAQAL